MAAHALVAAGAKGVLAVLGRAVAGQQDDAGLLAARQHSLSNVTFVVTNNDGGGIFRRLPIARHDPPFTDLFLTPHGLTFGPAAALYGLEYTAVRDAAGLEAALAAGGASTALRLIEVMTDGAADYERHRAVLAAVAAAIQEESSADWVDWADVRNLPSLRINH